MQIKVIADAEGNIVATAHVLPKQAKDSPSKMGIIAGPGQQVYEVEVAPEVVALPAAELHEKYRLEAKAVQANLVKKEHLKAD